MMNEDLGGDKAQGDRRRANGDTFAGIEVNIMYVYKATAERA